MAFRARNVSGTFEKRASGQRILPVIKEDANDGKWSKDIQDVVELENCFIALAPGSNVQLENI